MKELKYIYVAGPITQGDMMQNVRAAMDTATELMDKGFVPFLPHLDFSWHLVNPRTYEDWMKWDFAWLTKCDAVLRIPGKSPGADRECAEAMRLGIPVFYSIGTLLYARGHERQLDLFHNSHSASSAPPHSKGSQSEPSVAATGCCKDSACSCKGVYFSDPEYPPHGD